jgi:hypothetical protein
MLDPDATPIDSTIPLDDVVVHSRMHPDCSVDLAIARLTRLQSSGSTDVDVVLISFNMASATRM